MGDFNKWVDEHFSNSSVDLKVLEKAYNSFNVIEKKQESETIVVYPISANPPTWGHADVMMRAASKFRTIHWAVAKNRSKSPLFSDEQQIEMMNVYVKYYQLNNVIIDVVEGATIRYAIEVGADFILRGLRSSSDFQGEVELSAGNRGIDKKIETICMFSKPHFATISSTIVRELATLNEDIRQYVHPDVEKIVMGVYGPKKS
jgi:pantetheine-phosphate adenylyltransferase